MAMVMDMILSGAPTHTATATASCSSAPQLGAVLTRVLSFPRCAGLRISFPSKLPSAVTPYHRSSPGFSRGAIVSEQQKQETIAPAGAVTDKTWKELVLESDIPVLVDFWAPWCGPCRMIAPLIDELAKKYAGRITCLKLNTDESPNTATEYGIRSIPTVLIFKGGEKKDTVIGAVSKATLTSTIEKFLDR